MKGIRLTLISVLAVSVTATLAWATGGATHAVRAGGGGCLASYAAGFFGFQGDRLITSGTAAAAPYATAGALFLTADSSTSLTGTIGGYSTINKKGTVTRVTLSGTYAMATGQCIGSATITTSTGVTLHYDLVPVGWSSGGMATHVLFVETDPHGIGTLTATSM